MSTYQALIERGKAEGITIGEARGKHENTFQIAQKLKQEGASLALITKVTGLSLEEVQAL